MTRRELIKQWCDACPPDKMMVAELRALWAVLDAARELRAVETGHVSHTYPMAEFCRRLDDAIDAYDAEGGENGRNTK